MKFTGAIAAAVSVVPATLLLHLYPHAVVIFYIQFAICIRLIYKPRHFNLISLVLCSIQANIKLLNYCNLLNRAALCGHNSHLSMLHILPEFFSHCFSIAVIFEFVEIASVALCFVKHYIKRIAFHCDNRKQ